MDVIGGENVEEPLLSPAVEASQPPQVTLVSKEGAPGGTPPKGQCPPRQLSLQKHAREAAVGECHFGRGLARFGKLSDPAQDPKQLSKRAT